jgi:hypothetical protein
MTTRAVAAHARLSDTPRPISPQRIIILIYTRSSWRITIYIRRPPRIWSYGAFACWSKTHTYVDVCMREKETEQYGEREKNDALCCYETACVWWVPILHCTARVKCGVLSRRGAIALANTQLEMGSRKFSTEIFAFDCILAKNKLM